MRIRARLEEGLCELGGFEILGVQPVGVIAFSCPGCVMLARGDVLSRRGWYTSRIASPPGLQMTITPVHALSVDDYLQDLAGLLHAPATAHAPVAVSTY
jgi:hypothetical protein